MQLSAHPHNWFMSAIPDPLHDATELLNSLDPEVIASRIDELSREQQVLCVLLRSARARQAQVNRRMAKGEPAHARRAPLRCSFPSANSPAWAVGTRKVRSMIRAGVLTAFDVGTGRAQLRIARGRFWVEWEER